MRISPRLIVATVVLAAGVVFVTTLVRAVWYMPDPDTASSALVAAAPARAVVPGDLPERLRIPALGINAFVRQVGVNAQGNMATPGNFTDVGWYRYGTVPGFVGSAVIDGHVDNALALDGVFKHLSDLKAGDDIYVDTASSTPLHFVVVDVESYPSDQVPLDKLFNTKDKARLNLITCTGTWIQNQKEYDQRLVVYAELWS
ncbi:MAG TPA: class F sortase [Candidatus Paceibacterota bacterium]|jgi:LPXTG-site transpeptidase (sortase) family protein|nr:class F sortase [Candidatus Paceibacterota bacterium]